MKVRFSTEARRYLAREAAYLKERSPAGAPRFQGIVARARRVIRHSRNTAILALEDDAEYEDPPATAAQRGFKPT
jgi:hypothetical protein